MRIAVRSLLLRPLARVLTRRWCLCCGRTGLVWASRSRVAADEAARASRNTTIDPRLP